VNPPRFDSALEDLRKRLPKAGTRFAILFGSAARGEATEDSDIDLVISPKKPGDTEEVLDVVRGIESEHRVRIACIIAGQELQELDRQMLDTILREGKTLSGKMPRVDIHDLDLQSVRLVSFDLSGLPVAKKMRLSRELYGFETRKEHKGKTYVRRVRGKIDEWGGRKIGPGTVLVPESAARELDKILRGYGAKRMLVPMWIQRA